MLHSIGVEYDKIIKMPDLPYTLQIYSKKSIFFIFTARKSSKTKKVN